MSKPVVFILGPSGIGKTSLGNALATDLGMFHLLFDGHPLGDGVNAEKLRKEWDALLNTRNPNPLAAAVRLRVEASGHSGVVISCTSGVMLAEDGQAAQWHFPRSILSVMQPLGVRVAVLIGPLESCMDAAIRREGTNVTVKSWMESNSWWKDFQPHAFPENTLEAFSDRKRRPIGELVQELQRRFLV